MDIPQGRISPLSNDYDTLEASLMLIASKMYVVLSPQQSGLLNKHIEELQLRSNSRPRMFGIWNGDWWARNSRDEFWFSDNTAVIHAICVSIEDAHKRPISVREIGPDGLPVPE